MKVDIVERFLIHNSATLFDALKKIDANKSGFLIVSDDQGTVLGTLTDGDIRRALLKNISLDTSIQESNAYCSTFTWLSDQNNIDDAIDIFKDGTINFIPVLNSQGALVNVLLKKQFYSLLLQCKNVNLASDFSSIDASLMDFEIFNRPWGIYKTTILQNSYQAKIIQVKPGAKLSLQYHNQREEYWVVASGNGIAQIGDSFFGIQQGASVVIPRGCKHRLINTSETDYLVVSELQVGDYFGEDDIVRIEDEYGRVGEASV